MRLFFIVIYAISSSWAWGAQDPHDSSLPVRFFYDSQGNMRLDYQKLYQDLHEYLPAHIRYELGNPDVIENIMNPIVIRRELSHPRLKGWQEWIIRGEDHREIILMLHPKKLDVFRLKWRDERGYHQFDFSWAWAERILSFLNHISYDDQLRNRALTAFEFLPDELFKKLNLAQKEDYVQLVYKMLADVESLHLQQNTSKKTSFLWEFEWPLLFGFNAWAKIKSDLKTACVRGGWSGTLASNSFCAISDPQAFNSKGEVICHPNLFGYKMSFASASQSNLSLECGKHTSIPEKIQVIKFNQARPTDHAVNKNVRRTKPLQAKAVDINKKTAGYFDSVEWLLNSNDSLNSNKGDSYYDVIYNSLGNKTPEQIAVNQDIPSVSGSTPASPQISLATTADPTPVSARESAPTSTSGPVLSSATTIPAVESTPEKLVNQDIPSVSGSTPASPQTSLVPADPTPVTTPLVGLASVTTPPSDPQEIRKKNEKTTKDQLKSCSQEQSLIGLPEDPEQLKCGSNPVDGCLGKQDTIQRKYYFCRCGPNFDGIFNNSSLPVECREKPLTVKSIKSSQPAKTTTKRAQWYQPWMGVTAAAGIGLLLWYWNYKQTMKSYYSMFQPLTSRPPVTPPGLQPVAPPVGASPIPPAPVDRSRVPPTGVQ